MTIIYIISFILLAMMDNNISIYILPIIYILLGIGSSSYEIFDNVAIYEKAPKDYKTSYVTYERFIEGIVTTFIPIISYLFLKENEVSIKITFIISTILYAILFLYVKIIYGINKNKSK